MIKSLLLAGLFALVAVAVDAGNVSTNIVLNGTNDTVVATGSWESLDLYWTNGTMRVQYDATTSASSPQLPAGTTLLSYERGKPVPEIHMANISHDSTNVVIKLGSQR